MINRQTFLKSLIGIPIIGKLVPQEKVSNLPEFKHSYSFIGKGDYKIHCYSDVNPDSPSFNKGFNVDTNGVFTLISEDPDFRVTKQTTTVGYGDSSYYSLIDVNKGSRTYNKTIDTVYSGSIFEVEKHINDKFRKGEITLL